MIEPDVTLLHPSDLTDKYGFGDGDMAADLLDRWVETSAWKTYEKLNTVEYNGAHMYLSSRKLLCTIVDEFLLPKIRHTIPTRLQYVHTSHNPVRLVPAIADDVSSDDIEQDLADELEQQPSVAVPWTKIVKTCERLYPPRSSSWLVLYETLFYAYNLHREIADLSPDLPHWKREVTGFVLPPYIDGLAAQWDDATLAFASELITAREGIISRASVDETLELARKVLLL